MLSSWVLEASFLFASPLVESSPEFHQSSGLILSWYLCAWCNSDNAGNAVINAAESGAPFPLKRRDQLLDYILTLMGRDDNDGFVDYNELLRTQVYKMLQNEYLCLRWSHLSIYADNI